ncbi:MAG: hypothetical protein AB8H80_23140 [Planctomycetota bacterium]
MNKRLIALSFSGLLLAGCYSPGTDSSSTASVRVDEPEHVLEAELRDFQAAQQVFRERNMGKHEFDFDGHGRVTVREITLDGFPGNTYLRCRFHFQNRTVKPIVQSWVSLDVLDAEGRIVSTQSCHLIVPVPMPIARGSYYSDELRTPTYDAHLQEGWSWRVRCVSDLEEEEEPLEPPVQREPGQRPLTAPVIIKNRDQNGW